MKPAENHPWRRWSVGSRPWKDPKVRWLELQLYQRMYHEGLRGEELQERRREVISHGIHLPDSCPVLRIPIRYGNSVAGIDRNNAASVDRVNPSLGYIPGNVAILSLRANRLKNNSTVDELYDIIHYMENANQSKLEISL